MMRQLSKRFASARHMPRGDESGDDNMSIGSFISSTSSLKGATGHSTSSLDGGMGRRSGRHRSDSFDNRSLATISEPAIPPSERDLLEIQVQQRDSEIAALEKKRLSKQNDLEAIQKELDEERLRQMQESILHRLEYERLERQTRAMEKRLEALENDMQDKEAVHEYANLIKSVAPKSGVDSAYVMKLQTQLAKAMKKMDGTTAQMALVEQSCEEVVTSLKSEITEIVEDRCRTELELKKQLTVLETQKAEMEAEYEGKIRENEQAIERLQKERAALAEGETKEGGEGRDEKDPFASGGTVESVNALRDQLETIRQQKEEAESELRSQIVEKDRELRALERTHSQQERAMEALASALDDASAQAGDGSINGHGIGESPAEDSDDAPHAS